MWPRLKGKRAEDASVNSEILPAGLRIYAIGDIHGCVTQLDRVTQQIAADISANPCAESCIILLGDFIDRGPRSADVLERLASGSFPAPFLALRGNHEQMLLQFIDDPGHFTSWRRLGGLETLRSFGIEVPRIASQSGLEDAHARFVGAFPQEWRQLLIEMPSSYSIGNYFFCHAGVKPGIALTEQREHDLLWIRDEFLSSRIDHGKRIIHGHTLVEKPDVRPNRINIDTGAYLTGVLTCLVVESDTIRFITA